MSHCDQLLALLETGPKTAAELHRGVYCIVHSRIAELRARGHHIVCEKTPGARGPESFVYTLVGSLDDATSDARSLEPARAVDVASSSDTRQHLDTADGVAQLSLLEAA